MKSLCINYVHNTYIKNMILIKSHNSGGVYEKGFLLSASGLFLVGLIPVSELEDLYGLLNELAIKTREDAVTTENVRNMER